MNDINRCPNHELLVTYLYDECEPAERESMAAHLAICASCAEEFHGLRGARVQLAAWSPPALPLGFQLTRTESEPPAELLRPAGLASRSSQSEGLVRRSPMGEGGWWRQPLPAWAQAAAAVAIFAAGMSLGGARPEPGVETAATRSETRAAITAPVAVNTVSRADWARLDARLRSVENARVLQASVQLSRTSAGTLDERALVDSLTATIDARIAQRERQNMRLIAQEVDRLDGRYEQLEARTGTLEVDSEDFRRAASRSFGSSSLVRAASLQTGGR